MLYLRRKTYVKISVVFEFIFHTGNIHVCMCVRACARARIMEVLMKLVTIRQISLSSDRPVCLMYLTEIWF
jgi:hypothetical protein